MQSRLILLEGLPGTGKSTNSHFLRMQLERNGHAAQWLHECARPQPTQFFDDACFTHAEYWAFLRAHPGAREILNHLARFFRRTVEIDLLEAEWNYAAALGEEAMEALRAYHAWQAPPEKAGDYILDKYEAFAAMAARDPDCVYILDSSIFQFNIFGYLLEAKPYAEVEQEVRRLMAPLRSLNPTLFYLYRENVEETIDFLVKRRGIGALEFIRERDKDCPYYQGRPEGVEASRDFMRDYAGWAGRLFQDMDCAKLAVDLSGEDWTRAEDEMLAFLGIQRREAPDFRPRPGVYRSEALELTMEIEGNILRDPVGVSRRLTARSANEYYVEGLPTVLRFAGPDQIAVLAGQIAEKWTTLGAVYRRIGTGKHNSK